MICYEIVTHLDYLWTIPIFVKYFEPTQLLCGSLAWAIPSALQLTNGLAQAEHSLVGFARSSNSVSPTLNDL